MVRSSRAPKEWVGAQSYQKVIGIDLRPSHKPKHKVRSLSAMQ